jgi:hypothetical protein
MTTQTLYQRILESLADPGVPVSVRFADRHTQEKLARRLAERLQALPDPPRRQPIQQTFSSLSASKYDD